MHVHCTDIGSHAQVQETRAEVVYDNLDLVFIIIQLLSKISASRNCERKMVNDVTYTVHMGIMQHTFFLGTECMGP